MTTFDATIGAQVIQAPVSISSSGDSVIVAGTVGKIIKVLQLAWVINGAANVTYKSGSTALSGAMSMLANGSFFMDYIQLPLTCNLGDGFVINLDQAVSLGGTIWYTKS